MADGVGDTKPAAVRRQPSRLQKRAPASIQISPALEWKVAIPLLSPLIQSPAKESNPTAEIQSRTKDAASEKAVAVVMKKWVHPAAPLCYEPAPPPFLPFVCTGISLDI